MKKFKKCVISTLLLSVLYFSYIIWYEPRNSAYSAKDYLYVAQHFANKVEKEKALEFYKKAMACDPNDIATHKGLAKIYLNLGKYQQCINHLEKLYRLSQNDPDYLFQMGCVFFYKLHDISNAIAVTEKYVEHNFDNYNAYIILQDGYFQLGDFAKASEYSKKIEEAWFAKGNATHIDREWDGSNLSGKTMLLRDNVGIGDIFCWLRYTKQMKEQGAKIILETRKFLIPILSKCPYVDSFVARGDALPYFDYQILVGQMPQYFVKNEEDLKADGPYMHADGQLVDLWKKRLFRDKNFKIGVCWDPCVYKNKAGEPIKNMRAIPLCMLYPLSQFKQVTLYSLQQVNGVDQLAITPHYFKIKRFGAEFDKKYGSFMDTAAVMKNLNLVITADTSVAHLAGAMGVPVWMVLPLVSDWRWLSKEHETALYATMRIFRQKTFADWEPVVNEMCYELRKMLT